MKEFKQFITEQDEDILTIAELESDEYYEVVDYRKPKPMYSEFDAILPRYGIGNIIVPNKEPIIIKTVSTPYLEQDEAGMNHGDYRGSLIDIRVVSPTHTIRNYKMGDEIYTLMDDEVISFKKVNQNNLIIMQDLF